MLARTFGREIIMANTQQISTSLEAFDFERLFNQLGWQNPSDRNDRPLIVEDRTFTRKQVAQLSGVVVFEVKANDGMFPDAKTRRKVHTAITKLIHENVLIFVDEHRAQSVWLWVKNEKGKAERREHDYFRGQPVDLMLSKLVRINFELTDYDEDGNPPPIIEVARRLKDSLDVEKVTKKFYGEFQTEHLRFIEYIEGIEDERDRRWYASVILNRLMFIYFLQKKFFVDNKDNYLSEKFAKSKAKGKDRYFEDFLKPLFFVGFAKSDDDPEKRLLKDVLGDVPFLNGGLFLPHKLEQEYNIAIKDEAFENLLALFGRYSWNLDDTPGGKADEINPDVLGYIFEKYINQKAFGAYYTRPEITQYLCERTIYKLILDRVKELKKFDSMAELLLNLDSELCSKLWFDILPRLSILDPACGSGAFLVAALKTVLNVYSALIGKMETLGDKRLKDELEKIRTQHPSINYDIKKRIITNNLYGVDIMEEATEIAKLRLFMILVSSVHKKRELEPLPNIDFNILAGNSLIGILKVDEKSFDSIGHLEQMSFGFDQSAQTYRQILEDKNRSIEQYRNHALNRTEDESGSQADRLLMLRGHIEKVRTESYGKLNDLLLGNFKDLKIKFEQATWDEANKKEGKSTKRDLVIDDIETLHPFHWGYEFDRIMSDGGFDVIIANPPWEVFKPNGKEFLQDFSETITKKNMTIKEFEKEKAILLEDKDVRKEWLAYQSRFPYISAYYRGAKQYENQISVVNGKKQGTDINLYKLFLEQSFNLLDKGGRCGIILQSSIYTDLGAKQLREMLFVNTEVDGLLGFSNEKFIFENVHHAQKFCILTFAKGGRTQTLNAAFRINPREAVSADRLDQFLNSPDERIDISVDLVKKLSPDSMSVMEFKNELDITIAKKMLIHPLLGSEVDKTWRVTFAREFDMSIGDGKSFVSQAKRERYAPLFEGKMIWQFDHQHAEPHFWVKMPETRKYIFGNGDSCTPDQSFRLVFRRQASNTNERTLVSTVVPPALHADNLASVVSWNLGKRSVSYDLLLYLSSIFNSFVLDYSVRQRVTTNLNFFYLYQVPVPRLSKSNSTFHAIAKRAAKLICTTPEFDDFAKEVGLGSHLNGVTDETDRRKLRAELDAIIAHLYGLTEEEFAHILTTFPLVSETIKIETLNAFRDYERGLIK